MNHRWPPKHEEIVVTAHESCDGNEHHIRQCLACNITKVTVIPPRVQDSWHEWITSSGEAWIGEATPPCIPKGVVEGVDDPPREVPFT